MPFESDHEDDYEVINGILQINPEKKAQREASDAMRGIESLSSDQIQGLLSQIDSISQPQKISTSQEQQIQSLILVKALKDNLIKQIDKRLETLSWYRLGNPQNALTKAVTFAPMRQVGEAGRYLKGKIGYGEAYSDIMDLNEADLLKLRSQLNGINSNEWESQIRSGVEFNTLVANSSLNSNQNVASFLKKHFTENINQKIIFGDNSRAYLKSMVSYLKNLESSQDYQLTRELIEDLMKDHIQKLRERNKEKIPREKLWDQAKKKADKRFSEFEKSKYLEQGYDASQIEGFHLTVARMEYQHEEMNFMSANGLLNDADFSSTPEMQDLWQHYVELYDPKGEVFNVSEENWNHTMDMIMYDIPKISAAMAAGTVVSAMVPGATPLVAFMINAAVFTVAEIGIESMSESHVGLVEKPTALVGRYISTLATLGILHGVNSAGGAAWKELVNTASSETVATMLSELAKRSPRLAQGLQATVSASKEPTMLMNILGNVFMMSGPEACTLAAMAAAHHRLIKGNFNDFDFGKEYLNALIMAGSLKAGMAAGGKLKDITFQGKKISIPEVSAKVPEVSSPIPELQVRGVKKGVKRLKSIREKKIEGHESEVSNDMAPAPLRPTTSEVASSKSSLSKETVVIQAETPVESVPVKETERISVEVNQNTALDQAAEKPTVKTNEAPQRVNKERNSNKIPKSKDEARQKKDTEKVKEALSAALRQIENGAIKPEGKSIEAQRSEAVEKMFDDSINASEKIGSIFSHDGNTYRVVGFEGGKLKILEARQKLGQEKSFTREEFKSLLENCNNISLAKISRGTGPERISKSIDQKLNELFDKNNPEANLIGMVIVSKNGTIRRVIGREGENIIFRRFGKSGTVGIERRSLSDLREFKGAIQDIRRGRRINFTYETPYTRVGEKIQTRQLTKGDIIRVITESGSEYAFEVIKTSLKTGPEVRLLEKPDNSPLKSTNTLSKPVIEIGKSLGFQDGSITSRLKSIKIEREFKASKDSSRNLGGNNVKEEGVRDINFKRLEDLSVSDLEKVAGKFSNSYELILNPEMARRALGVDVSANIFTIKSAAKKLLGKYHPDKAVNLPKETQKKTH